MPQCVVIADDLTGANATGVLLKSIHSYEHRTDRTVYFVGL